MAVTVTCTKIRRTNGKIYIQFGKIEREFESPAHVKAWIGDSLDKEALQAMLIAKWLDVDPTGSNPTLVEGRTITVDLTLASNIVRIT